MWDNLVFQRQMKIWPTYLIILLTSCAIGQREVKYSEMMSEPKVSWDNGELLVRTENSKENSALLIYEIEPAVDQTDKVILLRGLEAAGKKFRTEFRLKLKDVNPDKLSDYRIYWVDPDNKRTELRIKTE
jgi:hypothetical protein